MAFDTLGLLSVLTAFVALFLNFSLLPFIVFCSNKHIGSYKYLLGLDTVFAGFFATLHSMAVPSFYVEQGAYVFHSTNTYLPPRVTTVVIFAYAFGYVMITEVLCVCFLYRYSVIQNRTSMMPTVNCTSRTKCIIAVVCLSVAIYITVSVMNGMSPNQKFTQSVMPGMYERTGYNLSEVGYAGGYIYNPETGDLVWSVFNVCFGFVSFILAGILLMIFLTVRIIREIQLSAALPTGLRGRSEQYQTRLFVLLLLQAVFPVVFTLCPVLLSFLFAVVRISPGELLNHLGTGMAFASAFEPILVIYLISDYRKAIYRFFNRDRVVSVSPVALGHTTTTVTGK